MERTVLLVDDDENLLHGLARALRQQPYHLFTAHSADEAMYVLKTRRVDVVVADERMPGMYGSELLAWVANNYPQVMRILLTGYATTETAIRAINKAKVYQFFSKPCNDARLAVTIRKALEEKFRLEENQRWLELNKNQLIKLERFNQELEILTHIVAQDIQQPLQAISDSCRSLGEECHDAFDPKAKRLVDSALEAAGEVQRFLSELQEHSTAERPTTCSNRSCSDKETAPPPICHDFQV